MTTLPHRPARPNRFGRAFAAVALAALAACGDGDANPGPLLGPALARGWTAPPLVPLAREWQRAAGLDPAEVVEHFNGAQVEHALARSDWRREQEPGLWSTPLPGGAFRFAQPGFLRLVAPKGSSLESPSDEPLEPGRFRVREERVELRIPTDAEPPESVQLVQYCESGRTTSDGVWQVRIGNDEFHSGLSAWSGGSAEVECALPAGARLFFTARFVTRFEGEPYTLRVRLDGEVVFEQGATGGAPDDVDAYVDLGARARERARLSFEVEGAPGQALFLDPYVGRADGGRHDGRPDVFVLLADTFRADGLASNGGPAELAPNLNRFAERALRFRNARSNAAWTLPSISTILTGLAPGQHTANDVDQSLPTELETLVERLARAGYRTGAVTDAAFFTPVHGLEQGFGSFVQHHPRDWDLDWTVERALDFLERDDGRPVFLVVHTYRTHMPYRVGPDEDKGPWDALRADGCKLLRSKEQLTREQWVERLRGCSERYRELYREGVRDLDRGFGRLLDALGERGRLERAVVAFTSDHGEALGENDDIFHTGDLWDSKLRVPLLLSAPGLAPRDVDFGVSLLDLAPTVAELAGLEPDPRWHGTPLHRVTEERPTWAFRLQSKTQVALVDGGRKLLAADPADFARGTCALAFDLEGDPREERPVEGEPWPAQLAPRHAKELAELLVPATAAVEAPLSPEQVNELEALGYGGGDDEDEKPPTPPPAKPEKP